MHVEIDKCYKWYCWHWKMYIIIETYEESIEMKWVTTLLPLQSVIFLIKIRFSLMSTRELNRSRSQMQHSLFKTASGWKVGNMGNVNALVQRVFCLDVMCACASQSKPYFRDSKTEHFIPGISSKLSFI